MTGTDSHGNYSGSVADRIVTWTPDKATVRGIPAGYDRARGQDQNGGGTVLLNAESDAAGSRAFTLEPGGFHALALPEGSTGSYAVAMNNHGDIVGRAYGLDGETRQLVWRASDPEHPVTLNIEQPYPDVTDIDDDGTVLFNSGGVPYLWRDGETTALTVPAEWPYAYGLAIHNGQVVGLADAGRPDESGGYLWRNPATPASLPGSAYGEKINSSGLVLGRLPEPGYHLGPSATWLRTSSLGELPLPSGYADAAGTVLGDDNVIAGQAADNNPESGGRPVVWHYSLR